MPNASFPSLADQASLRSATPTLLVARMLAAPRCRALTENFGEQWAARGKLASPRLPSNRILPAFTYNVRKAEARKSSPSS